MEKSSIQSKSMFSKFLVNFRGPPPSPAACRGGFSGKISIIPAEARRRSRSEEIESREPTSPKVSCIGQIKQKNKSCNSKKIKSKNKKKLNIIANHRSSGVAPARRSESSADDLRGEVPSISKMKRFASSRDALSSFDWTAYVAGEEGEESAPIGRETAAQRKEVNLWRRRSVSPLPSLRVHHHSTI